MFNYIGVRFVNDNVNDKTVVAITYSLFIFFRCKIIKIELKIKLHHPIFFWNSTNAHKIYERG